MNTDKNGENVIEAILKEAHRRIEPPDSWAALRARIDNRMNDRKSASLPLPELQRSVVFWRRMALVMAACFVLAAGLLIYTIGFVQRTEDSKRQWAVATNQGLFSQAQLNQLMKTFSNVRELFGQQSPWIMVGSGSNAEIGIDEIARTADTSNVVAVRLALNPETEDAGRRYFDIVTFSNQRINCQLPMADASGIDISLRPTLENDGIVALEIDARVNGSSVSKSATTVANDVFTSLVRLRANGHWVNIDAVAQLMSNI
ncbi:MAG: hypothetical protein ACYSTF_01055 [Planctomycetota bacterium]|jgi:hypothetical protein